jgi:hypothetical protein
VGRHPEEANGGESSSLTTFLSPRPPSLPPSLPTPSTPPCHLLLSTNCIKTPLPQSTARDLTLLPPSIPTLNTLPILVQATDCSSGPSPTTTSATPSRVTSRASSLKRGPLDGEEGEASQPAGGIEDGEAVAGGRNGDTAGFMMGATVCERVRDESGKLCDGVKRGRVKAGAGERTHILRESCWRRGCLAKAESSCVQASEVSVQSPRVEGENA